MKLNDVNVATQPAQPELPAQAISEEVLLEKYAKGGERTIDDVRRRVARALAAVELPEQRAHPTYYLNWSLCNATTAPFGMKV